MRLLRGGRHHVGWLPCWKRSLARLCARFLASSAQDHGDLWLWSSGDRGLQLDVCRFFKSIALRVIESLNSLSWKESYR